MAGASSTKNGGLGTQPSNEADGIGKRIAPDGSRVSSGASPLRQLPRAPRCASKLHKEERQMKTRLLIIALAVTLSNATLAVAQQQSGPSGIIGWSESATPV